MDLTLYLWFKEYYQKDTTIGVSSHRRVSRVWSVGWSNPSHHQSIANILRLHFLDVTDALTQQDQDIINSIHNTYEQGLFKGAMNLALQNALAGFTLPMVQQSLSELTSRGGSHSSGD